MTGFHVAQAAHELTMEVGVTSNSLSFCPLPPRAEIPGRQHHTTRLLCLESNLRLGACLPIPLPTELLPQLWCYLFPQSPAYWRESLGLCANWKSLYTELHSELHIYNLETDSDARIHVLLSTSIFQCTDSHLAPRLSRNWSISPCR